MAKDRYIPRVYDFPTPYIPYDEPRNHAVGGVEGGSTIVHGKPLKPLDAHGEAGAPKRTQSFIPVHPNMTPGNRGHATTKAVPPAATLTDLQGKDVTKRLDVPPIHRDVRGRNDCQVSTFVRGVGLGDMILDEAIDAKPGSHPSHTSNMRKKW
jgi:hypothetical protein